MIWETLISLVSFSYLEFGIPAADTSNDAHSVNKAESMIRNILVYWSLAVSYNLKSLFIVHYQPLLEKQFQVLNSRPLSNSWDCCTVITMLNAFRVGLNDGTEGESAEKPHHYFKEQGWGCEWQGFSEEDVLDTEYHGVRRTTMNLFPSTFCIDSSCLLIAPWLKNTPEWAKFVLPE